MPDGVRGEESRTRSRRPVKAGGEEARPAAPDGAGGRANRTELTQLLDEPFHDETHMTMATSNTDGDETPPADAAYVESIRTHAAWSSS